MCINDADSPNARIGKCRICFALVRTFALDPRRKPVVETGLRPRIVWLASLTNHSGVGSFGKHNDAESFMDIHMIRCGYYLVFILTNQSRNFLEKVFCILLE
ncbi:hypothetical protein AVEN_100802-1 [Araneus ventricosus]|uniref:Uncharacterized protein n=1 Tax=Araneus ventricosus TaxID=182803 RepID=A0A4Y2AVZ3_ARAVE|nr:hypothetical protein AVEN_100802-1 [Araneus ventricosus]